MKVLFITPAKGGEITMDYLNDAMRSIHEIGGVKFKHEVLDHDHLIYVCRDYAVNMAIQGGFDKLLMIDSDQLWEPEDILKLLQSDKKIVGGTYPYKELPIKLVFVAMPGIDYTNKTLKEVEVKFLPTGFICIDVEALKTMSEKAISYEHFDRKTNKHITLKNFFRVGPRNNIPETEDWGFCNFARECGFKVYLNTTVVVDHVGKYRFSIRAPKGAEKDGK